MIRKVIIGAFALFLTAATVNAQTTQFGVKGGLNIAKITNDEDGNTTKSLPSFNAGLVADVGITPMFSVRTGLDVQGKGARWESKVNDENYVQTDLRPIYLEIPATFTVNFPMGAGTKLYAGAGPYVGFGIAGNSNIKTVVNGDVVDALSDKDKIEWGNENGKLKRLDAGANVAGGVTFNNKFGLHLQYGIGLVDIDGGNDNSKKNNTRTFGVSGIIYF